MLVFLGPGKKTVRQYGKEQTTRCYQCKSKINRKLIKMTSWFHIAFIPIIPYRRDYFLFCATCQMAEPIDKKSFDRLRELFERRATEELIGEAVSEQDEKTKRKDEKTKTQLAYIEEMKAIERERAKLLAEEDTNTQ